ncbi:MAG TPA: MarR family EPS-associated transcriptional regulator [Candidatus Rifleibacterium sp.]|nr:MarR family EPS-associated transcriptional regulator [Candidatus Rifleibacterium sp.]HPT48327.1 MarR family EPS-associated transcriptional regulator [Candidatus Rifleibacterium sp.]
MNDEITYKLFKALEEHPATNQRHLAASLEMSLGKLNYCLKALLDKGLVKAENFMANPNKRGYLYQLTSAGIQEKARVTCRFLKAKISEFEKLKSEIQTLKTEVATQETFE